MNAICGEDMPEASTLREDIIAYEAMQDELEANHLGKWALVYNQELIGVFESFSDAAVEAVQKFGKGPYLIRRIGSSSVTLPTSVMYGPLHAINVVRV